MTRPHPAAEATGARLSALGFTPVLAPLLSEKRLPLPPAIAPDAALAVTSRAAARRLPEVDDLTGRIVFAVGAATAAQARRAGARDVRVADGYVDALLALILSSDAPRIVHLCGRDTRGALAERLCAAGRDASQAVVYEMAPAPLLAAVLPAEEIAATPDAALLYSPRTASVFASLTEGSPWAGAPCAALSEAVAAPLRASGRRVVVAAKPCEDALFDALDRLLGRAR